MTVECDKGPLDDDMYVYQERERPIGVAEELGHGLKLHT